MATPASLTGRFLGRNPAPKHLGSRPRALWSLADQGVSSLTNVVVALIVANQVSKEEFGAFAAALLTYLLALGVDRSLTTEMVAIRFSTADRERQRAAAASATGSAFVLGYAIALLVALAALFMSGPRASALFALAITLPGLLTQDAWRYVLFAQGRPDLATINDLIWAATQLGGLGLAFALGNPSPAIIVGIWGGSAGVAALAASVQTRILPRPQQAPAWIQAHFDLGGRFLLEFAAASGAAQATALGVGFWLGDAALGGLRGSQTLLGPLNVLSNGLAGFLLPEGRALFERHPRRLSRLLLGVAAGLAVASFGWGTFMALLPDAVGERLLHDTWTATQPLLLPAAIAAAGAGFVNPAFIGLRIVEAAHRSLRTRLITTPIFMATGVAGAVLGGVKGFVVATAVAAWINAPVWWNSYRRERAMAAEEPDPAASAEQPSAEILHRTEPIDEIHTDTDTDTGTPGRDRRIRGGRSVRGTAIDETDRDVAQDTTLRTPIWVGEGYAPPPLTFDAAVGDWPLGRLHGRNTTHGAESVDTLGADRSDTDPSVVSRERSS